MATFAMPTFATLKAVEQKLLPQLTLDDYIFDHFVTRNVEGSKLIWRQLGDFIGMQGARGAGGQFNVVEPVETNQFVFDPGFYGDASIIDEATLTHLSKIDSFSEPRPLMDIVSERVNQLLNRRINRITQTMWTLLSTGKFEAKDRDGTIKATAKYSTFQSYTPTVPWSTVATATPYADITKIRTFTKGTSVSFGRGAKMYINPNTAEWLLTNKNANDLLGRRTNYGATFNSIGAINDMFKSQSGLEDLPEIILHDASYKSDGTDGYAKNEKVWRVPDNKAIVIGRRTNNAPLGEYQFTRNAQLDDFSPSDQKLAMSQDVHQTYMYVRDSLPFSTPRRIEVEDGHNGGPVVFYPEAVLIMNVGS